MNKQIIINVTLAVLVITCAIIALAISQQAERTSQQYIDPDSKQEQKISSETKDNYTKKQATRIIVSASPDIFKDNGITANEYEVLVTALTEYDKTKLGNKYREAAINTASFSKSGGRFSFEVRLGGPDSRDRRTIDINRISSDRMSIAIKQDNVIEFEKSNINITKTVRYRELRD